MRFRGRPRGLRGESPGVANVGPRRPSLVSVLATFGLDVPRVKELGAAVAAARALRARAAAAEEG